MEVEHGLLEERKKEVWEQQRHLARTRKEATK